MHSHSNILCADYEEMFFLLIKMCSQSLSIMEQGRKQLFYLMTHSTHFIYGYMASDIW